MFEYFMTLFRVYKVYIFLSFNILFGQFSSNVVHVEIISDPEKVEASIIFDEIIDRDDVNDPLVKLKNAVEKYRKTKIDEGFIDISL